jgi:RNA polymerase sigma factor (sigma-70 family)
MEHREEGRSTSALDDPFIVKLYQQHALSLMTYVRRHVSTREDAEDIVLEVFLAVLKQRELAFLSEEKQLAWLRRVAYYKWVDHHRHVGIRPLVSLEEAAEQLLVDEGQSPEQRALRNEENALLRARMGQLPEHYQMILQLRFANGMRCTDIASHLQKSEGAIRMLLSRALNTLREIYAKQKEEQR